MLFVLAFILKWLKTYPAPPVTLNIAFCRCFTLVPAGLAERTQGMSISIGAGYDLPEEQKRLTDTGSSSGAERSAVVDDLNNKLQVNNIVRWSDLKVERAHLGEGRVG